MNPEKVGECYLKPGDFCLALQPAVIKTVLGSCLTVTMYSPRTGIGAACHALLPTCRDNDHHCPPGTCLNTFRYVECVIPEMLRRMQSHGLMVSELEVKIFGGADMLSKSLAAHQQVGSLNVRKAKAIFARMGMTIRNGDVGGGAGRKLIFDTRTGEVWIKRLNKSL